MSRVFRKRTYRSLPDGAIVITKRKRTRRPLPDGAEFVVEESNRRVATWTDKRGGKREAEVIERDGGECIVVESGTWYMRYRDASGIVRERSTECRTREGAMRVLADVEVQQERIRMGIVSFDEAHMADHARSDIGEHVGAYLEHMLGKGCTPRHIEERRRQLGRVMRECSFKRVRDLSGEEFERWLAARAADGMGARNRNCHRSAMLAFARWLVLTRRLVANPFERVAAANERVDRRRVRRALSVEELERLFEAARVRPLHDALYRNRGEGPAQLSEATRQHLADLGEQRALIYKTLVVTGLRLGELRSIRVSQVNLDHDPPFIELKAEHEKARRGARLPLPAALADELASHIERRLSRVVGHPGRSNVLAFDAPDADPRLFDLPEKMTRVFDRDCARAGIEKRDRRGRTVDVHCLRHTFGTMLARSGVPLQVAQRAMRHSTPTLTANVYTHLDLGDVAGAVGQLPCIGDARKQAVAGNGGSRLPLFLPLADGKTCVSESISGKTDTGKQNSGNTQAYYKKARDLKGNPVISTGCEGGKEWWAVQDSNLRPPACKAGALTD